MIKYRYYNNIAWGSRYNPETRAHHVEATDYDALREKIPPSTDTQSIQVKTGIGWEWVTSVPVHLGGIAKHWHDEKV